MSDNTRLDLSLLDSALSKLQTSIADLQSHPGVEAYRDSVVIRFLYTYELAIQVIRRYVQLEHRKPMPESELTTARIVRRANALGILQEEWEGFHEFRDARNGIAHTYSDEKAAHVASLSTRFASEVQFLLQQVAVRLYEQ